MMDLLEPVGDVILPVGRAVLRTGRAGWLPQALNFGSSRTSSLQFFKYFMHSITLSTKEVEMEQKYKNGTNKKGDRVKFTVSRTNRI
jgi:hypothetical protein